jgi:hypothetical protein
MLTHRQMRKLADALDMLELTLAAWIADMPRYARHPEIAKMFIDLHQKDLVDGLRYAARLAREARRDR